MTTKELILKNLSVGAYQGKIKRFELVELGGTTGIPAGTTGRVAFNDQPQLRDQANQIIIVTNIEVFMDTVQAQSQYTNTIAGFPPADLPNAALVMYINGEESARLIPLAKLNHIQDGTPTPFQKDLQGFDMLSNVDWDKSYVQFSQPTSAPYVIPFGVTYLRFQKDPQSGEFVEK